MNKLNLLILLWGNLLKNKQRQLKIKENIFKTICNEILDKIEELNKKINYDNLKYTVINTGEEFEFDKSGDPLVFLNDIKTGKISLEEAKNLQKGYNEYLTKYETETKMKNKKKLWQI